MKPASYQSGFYQVMTFLQSSIYLYGIMHIKCEIDLEIDIFFQKQRLKVFYKFSCYAFKG